MDDPMRGVDIGTKQEVYGMIRDEAAKGRTFVWYTTEIDELVHADHVYVFREGAIVADFPRPTTRKKCCTPRSRSMRMNPAPVRGMRRAFARHRAGCDLLAESPRNQPSRPSLMCNLAVPIALATIAQMCVMAVNDLDLASAPISASSCASRQPGCMKARCWGSSRLPQPSSSTWRVGALIHLRNLPSIVVTLGMSFVWLGLAILVLPTPGGKSPEWLAWLMKAKTPLVPFPIIATAIIAVVAHLR